MLRQIVPAARGAWAAAAAARRAVSTSAAALAEEGAAPPAGSKEFLAAWAQAAPSNMNPPEFPSQFLDEGAAASGEPAGADGEKFTVNFYTPAGVVAESKFEQVTLPGVEGYFGVKATHVPTIAQLKPGVVELHDGTDVSKFFVSGGFAFVHPNSATDICVLEAAPLDQFDAPAVKQALTAASSAAGNDEFENAVNRASQELYMALDAALDSKS